MDKPEMKAVTGLLDHEANSQARYECLSEQLKEVAELCESKEKDMGMDNISDKVNLNINPGGGDGGFGGIGGLAALMMANRGDDSQSNIWASILPALMNQRNDSGFGGGGVWPILLLALLRNGGGGLFGGGNSGDGGVAGVNVLDNLSDIRAAIPTTALENQNAILGAIAQQTLGNQQGFAGVKDSVQNSLLAMSQAVAGINQNVSAQGCQTRETIKDDGEKTRALITQNTITDLQRQLGVAQAAAAEERHHARVREVEVNVSQQVNQQQAQNQFQSQLQAQIAALTQLVHGVAVNNNRSAQDIVNLGTMLASGVQTPTTSQVNR